MNKHKHGDNVHEVKFKKVVKQESDRSKSSNSNQEAGINESSGNIQFESNDLLDDYK